jgi:hypothetical protein
MNQELYEAALAYIETGKSIIPLRNKRPVIRWKKFQKELPTYNDVNDWFARFAVQQIAIITGNASGGIWILDCDGDLAVEWSLANVPGTPIKSKSRRGVHYYFKVPKGISIRNGANVVPEAYIKKTSQIDVRGEGGYGVVPPSPFTGGKYEWLSRGAWDELPEWSLGGKTIAPRRIRDPFKNLDKVTDPGVERNEEDGSIFGYPEETGNLMINLAGVEPITELDLSPVSMGERNQKLTQVIGHYINLGLTQEELIDMGRGWNLRNSPPLTDKEVIQTVRSIIKTHEINHIESIPLEREEVKTEELIFTSVKPNDDLDDSGEDTPIEFRQPGGLLEEIINYAAKSQVINFPLLGLAGGLCLLGTLVGEKIITETHLRTNLYIITLSPSGSGKNSPLNAIRKLLKDTGIDDDNLLPEEIASTQAVYKRLETHPCQLFCIDEVGDFLDSFKSKEDSHKKELGKLLKILFSSAGQSTGKIYADTDKNITIPWTHVSFYGTGESNSFWDSLTAQDVKGGMISRNIIFNLDVNTVRPLDEINTNIPHDLREAIKNLDSIERQYMPGDKLSRKPIPKIIKKNTAAQVFFREWRDQYIRLQRTHKDHPENIGVIYSRVAEHASKLALVHAVSRSWGLPSEVNLEDIGFATSLMDWNIPRIVQLVIDNISYNPQDAFRRRIIKKGREKGILTEAEIYGEVKDCTAKQLEDVLKILIGSKTFTFGFISEGNESKKVWIYKGERW